MERTEKTISVKREDMDLIKSVAKLSIQEKMLMRGIVLGMKISKEKIRGNSCEKRTEV